MVKFLFYHAMKPIELEQENNEINHLIKKHGTINN